MRNNRTEEWKAVLRAVPGAPSWRIDWKRIEESEFLPLIEKMKAVRQNPVWHGEGDAWTHTKMVCEALASLPGYRRLERRKQEEVFFAALLHDIGKISCTRLEDRVWISPNHSAVGSRMARELLWLTYRLCGTAELQRFRETICTLIRYHSIPPHILEQGSPEYRMIKIASNGALLSDFSIELLCLLSEADVCGRINDSIAESLELVGLCRLQAKESGCLTRPVTFRTAYSEYAYLAGRSMAPGQECYDDTWGEIILMGGLPGTGKDTWIREHYSEYPMVSLDELRKQMGVEPTDKQGPVINAARELARNYLRQKIPFVWNATSLTPMIREKQVRFFANYHASVKIVHLEAEWDEQLRRNQNRKAVVPEQVIRRMLNGMTMPERFEAHQVGWYCV